LLREEKLKFQNADQHAYNIRTAFHTSNHFSVLLWKQVYARSDFIVAFLTFTRHCTV